MSVGYYLCCPLHKKAVFISDNKGNPFRREDYLEFYLKHIIDHHEVITLISEYDLDYRQDIEVINICDDDCPRVEG